MGSGTSSHELLSRGAGNATAWGELFLELLRCAGIEQAKLRLVRPIRPATVLTRHGQISHAGYRLAVLAPHAVGMGHPTTPEAAAAGNKVVDLLAVVEIGGRLYCPALRPAHPEPPPGSLQEFENWAFRGYITAHDFNLTCCCAAQLDANHDGHTAVEEVMEPNNPQFVEVELCPP